MLVYFAEYAMQSGTWTAIGGAGSGGGSCALGADGGGGGGGTHLLPTCAWPRLAPPSAPSRACRRAASPPIQRPALRPPARRLPRHIRPGAPPLLRLLQLDLPGRRLPVAVVGHDLPGGVGAGAGGCRGRLAARAGGCRGRWWGRCPPGTFHAAAHQPCSLRLPICAMGLTPPHPARLAILLPRNPGPAGQPAHAVGHAVDAGGLAGFLLGGRGSALLVRLPPPPALLRHWWVGGGACAVLCCAVLWYGF